MRLADAETSSVAPAIACFKAEMSAPRVTVRALIHRGWTQRKVHSQLLLVVSNCSQFFSQKGLSEQATCGRFGLRFITLSMFGELLETSLLRIRMAGGGDS
ncbi:MAG: hypothetical protein EAZ81_12960 [Verrucomicrobia bacterium]|jgi:hypothetical protein|nr:MAG: hypothetical protein EAZ81_12960 [Verrucomicrobiota bacterium]